MRSVRNSKGQKHQMGFFRRQPDRSMQYVLVEDMKVRVREVEAA